jgi:hypothetical protein
VVVALVAGTAIVALTMFGPILSVSDAGGDTIFVPNPVGVIPYFHGMDAMPTLALVLELALGVPALASIIARYRGASETTRLQLRWLLAAVSCVFFIVIASVALSLLFPRTANTVWILVVLAFPTVPIAIGFAVMRYRLYEIDRIVNRALVYGTVTAILAGVFAAVTLITQRLFVALTEQTSEAAIVLTTLTVATLFTPVRKPVERLVDRYFKYDQRLFGAYRDELRRALDVLAPTPAALRLARETLTETGAVAAAVIGADGKVIASAGSWPAESTITVPVISDGAALTAVVIGPRRDGRPHRPQALAALGEVAALAATAATAIPDGAQAGHETDAAAMVTLPR